MEENASVYQVNPVSRITGEGSAELLLSQMCNFTPMIFTVQLWGSEVANSKTEIHLTNTAGEVSMRCHIYAMSLLLNARVTLLR